MLQTQQPLVSHRDRRFYIQFIPLTAMLCSTGQWSNWTVQMTILCIVMPECIRTSLPVRAEVGRTSRASEKIVLISGEEQTVRIEEAKIDCFRRIIEDPYPQTGALYCNRTWDGIMCWPDVPVGQLSIQPCPRYIDMFRMNAYASRYCLPNGSWFVHPLLNRTWTNFMDCAADNFSVSHNLKLMGHVGHIKTISHVGYGLSVITLIAAIFIMVHFRKLRCPRNTLHVNLFASFILRAMMSFLKESLFVSGLGLPKDILRSHNDTVLFRDDVTHWECRLVMALFNYAISTNYMWIFVEGLYLHTLIFMELFQETSCVTWYIVFGWVASLAFVVPWVTVRVLLENNYCWNIHPTPGYFWIIKTPISITVLVNFVFFVNIVRVLFTKLNAMNTPETQRYRHRKLAKSTLVLIPLFGVPYMVFLGLPDNMNETIEMVKLYFEMTFNSFNGFVVAMLFCFLNGEVQNEFQKGWDRHRLRNSEFLRCQPSRTLPSSAAVHSPSHAAHSIHQSTAISHAVDSIHQSTPGSHVATPPNARQRETSSIESERKSQDKNSKEERRKDTQVLFLMTETMATVVEVDKEQSQPFLNPSMDIYF